METLMLKLAEILQISIESAIELYPTIKSQFISYNILNMISGITLPPMILIGVGIFITVIIITVEMTSSWGVDEDLVEQGKRILKVLGIIFLGLTLTFTISEILKYILATDFMIIKTFLN